MGFSSFVASWLATCLSLGTVCIVNLIRMAQAAGRLQTCHCQLLQPPASPYRGAARITPPAVPAHPCLPCPACPADTLKYYGFELGAMVNYDKKSGNSIVNGAHDAGRLSELLEGFIKK